MYTKKQILEYKKEL